MKAQRRVRKLAPQSRTGLSEIASCAVARRRRIRRRYGAKKHGIREFGLSSWGVYSRRVRGGDLLCWTERSEGIHIVVIALEDTRVLHTCGSATTEDSRARGVGIRQTLEKSKAWDISKRGILKERTNRYRETERRLKGENGRCIRVRVAKKKTGNV